MHRLGWGAPLELITPVGQLCIQQSVLLPWLIITETRQRRHSSQFAVGETVGKKLPSSLWTSGTWLLHIDAAGICALLLLARVCRAGDLHLYLSLKFLGSTYCKARLLLVDLDLPLNEPTSCWKNLEKGGNLLYFDEIYSILINVGLSVFTV